MCGIAGIVNFRLRAFEPRAIKRMCDALAHRGPDDSGYYFETPASAPLRTGQFTDPEFSGQNRLAALDSSGSREFLNGHAWQLALGHRRLSILDLTREGHQPMRSGDGRLCLLYNGEIYNHREIRADLEAAGRTFHSRSDTEVLLKLWEERGPACLQELNGMFAFALWDARRQELYLARDRFGIKPLYYYRDADFFVFASETKGILASGLVEAAMDPAAVVEYFTFQNTFGDQTLFRDVKILPPGRYLTLDVRSGGLRESTYWQPVFSPGGKTFEENSAEVARDFETAVSSQLISDVPLGAFLSGGMDSGSVVAVAGKKIPHMATFTLGFDMTHVNGIEQGFDEREMSEKLSALLQTEHYESVLHAGDMPQAMEKLTWHVDDLRVGMCHPNWYASRLASRFVKVCLSGTGGDELFGGYPWRFQFSLCPSVEEFDRAYLQYWHRLMPADELNSFFQAGFSGYYGRAVENARALLAQGTVRDGDDLRIALMNRLFRFELRTFLHGLLVIEDRVSMAHSMETRVPFLDHGLTALAMGISPAHKSRFDASVSQFTEGKSVLRHAMRKFLPDEYVYQRKQGFSPPDENWYRGPSMNYIKEILLDGRSLGRSFFNPAAVRNKLEEHFAGRKNNRLLIWSLLSFEWLQRHYIDGAPAPKRSEALETAALS